MGGQGGRGELIHHVGTEGGTALLPGPGWVGGGGWDGEVVGSGFGGRRGFIFCIKYAAF